VTRPFTIGQRVALRIVPKLTAGLLALIGATLRFEVIAEEGARPETPPAKGHFLFLASLHPGGRLVFSTVSLLHFDQPEF
jgi:hypothetical protein